MKNGEMGAEVILAGVFSHIPAKPTLPHCSYLEFGISWFLEKNTKVSFICIPAMSICKVEEEMVMGSKRLARHQANEGTQRSSSKSMGQGRSF